MAKQTEYFSIFRSNLTSRINTKSANTLLSKFIFLISSGGNDVFAIFSQSPAAHETAERGQFSTTLASNYGDHVKSLYNLGARKFALIDVPPIGCCPYSRSLSSLAECIGTLNELALEFNKAVKVLLQNLISTLGGMKYSMGSSYAVVSNIVANPEALGYKEVRSACCGTGNLNAATLCTPNATYCNDR